MTYNFDASITLSLYALILLGALLNGLHPALLSNIPLLLGSLLGNKLPLRKARQAMSFFALCLFGVWLTLGAFIAFLWTFFYSPAALATAAIILALCGIAEVKTALEPQGIVMRFRPYTWHRLRKHAYKLQHSRQMLALVLRFGLPLFGFTGITYAGTILLVSDESTIPLVILGSYSFIFILPLLILILLSGSKLKLSHIHLRLSRHGQFLHIIQAILLFTFCSLLALEAKGG